jgi:ribosomal protein S18 acetylase RimI-like enzyme
MIQSLPPVMVRPARHEDLDVLVRFSAAMAQETERRILDVSRLRQGTASVLEDPRRGFYMVAEIAREPGKGSVVGQLLITYEWSDWRNATFWWIQSVYVDPAWRGRGVYRRMHEAVVAQAQARGDVCGIRLYVERDNETAQKTYDRVGLKRSPYEMYEEDFTARKTDRQNADNPDHNLKGR